MAVNKIVSRFSGRTLYECESNSMLETLQEAVKAGANLADASLAGASLAGANLVEANLAGANLAGANLAGANLDGANLYGANLDGASLYGANLAGANLYGANLAGANLYGAWLDGANLAGANLVGAWLYGHEVTELPILTGYIGSRKSVTLFWPTRDGIFVHCGCYFGSVDDFASRVKEKHGDTQYSKEYAAAIEFARLAFAAKTENNAT
ncbi:pentapeptide repeat-containing protein [Candidatus Pacearchaeota archaeon]|jgi:uncharacterized protein YjbI with pentapeptide repeats|nr:pentapeptide repeat-containing protein [Candidatus Pacearchaeota archaeon]